MNLIAHATLSWELFKDKKLTKDDANLLLIGSIIPDVCEFGIVDERQSHEKGLEFFKYLNNKNYYFGLGVILHGDRPRALDWYGHQYIAGKHQEISKIINDYKKCIGNLSQEWAAHIITEFCFDHLILQKDKTIPKRIYAALQNPKVESAIIDFANFFEIDKKHLKALRKIIRSKHFYKFLSNFSTIKGTAHSFRDFIFYKGVRDKNNSHLIKKLRRVTQSSLDFFRAKILDRPLVTLFERCTELVKIDCDQFILDVNVILRNMIKANKL